MNDGPEFSFFDPSAEVENLQGNLPHWRQEGVCYFVTFRLADSIPTDRMRAWNAERQAWLRRHPEPRDAKTIAQYCRLFPKRYHEWLDDCLGSCMLQDPSIKKLVESSLGHFDGTRYLLDEFVVMPNHVHALVTPTEPHSLSDVLHSWKSFTSHEINKQLGKAGQNWQEETFDHIVRNEGAFEWFRKYIRNNPKEAKE